MQRDTRQIKGVIATMNWVLLTAIALTSVLLCGCGSTTDWTWTGVDADGVESQHRSLRKGNKRSKKAIRLLQSSLEHGTSLCIDAVPDATEDEAGETVNPAPAEYLPSYLGNMKTVSGGGDVQHIDEIRNAIDHLRGSVPSGTRLCITADSAPKVIEPVSGAGSATEPVSGAGSATEPVSGAGSATEPVSGAGSATEPVSGAGSATEPVSGAGSATEPVSGAGSATEPASGAGSPTEPASGAGSATEPVKGAGSAAEPVSGGGLATEPVDGAGPATEPSYYNDFTVSTALPGSFTFDPQVISAIIGDQVVGGFAGNEMMAGDRKGYGGNGVMLMNVRTRKLHHGVLLVQSGATSPADTIGCFTADGDHKFCQSKEGIDWQWQENDEVRIVEICSQYFSVGEVIVPYQPCVRLRP